MIDLSHSINQAPNLSMPLSNAQGSAPDGGQSIPRPELFFGIVSAVGTDVTELVDEIESALARVQYDTERIRVSDLLEKVPGVDKAPEGESEPDRYERLMTGGTRLRATLKRGDALALLASRAIATRRQERLAAGNHRSVAYVLRGLKTQAEVKRLRSIYGDAFFLVGAYSPRARRIETLARRFSPSAFEPAADMIDRATSLVKRDESETGTGDFGQNVRDTFPLSDVFVHANDQSALRAGITRFVEILFGHPFHTPTVDEQAMCHAAAAALRSSALGRQVGAAIATDRGVIIATGTNEVPRKGGGVYLPGDNPDRRDFQLGRDSNDEMKAAITNAVVGELSRDLIPPGSGAGDVIRLKKRVQQILDGTRIKSLIEFGRAVHAEMDALMCCVRLSVSPVDLTLYTTTFPCHECARHIVAAGLARVVYIEPYAKSLAHDLHNDAIQVEPDGTPDGDHIPFVPFVGVAPRLYFKLFEAPPRKRSDGSGRIVEWSASAARPRFDANVMSYMERETSYGKDFGESMREVGLLNARTE